MAGHPCPARAPRIFRGALKSERKQIEWITGFIAKAQNVDGVLPWRLPPVIMLNDFPSASMLADSWNQSSKAPCAHMAVNSRIRSGNKLLPMLRTLQHPDRQSNSVFVANAFASDGRVDWHMPFHFAVLPDDPLTTAFATFSQLRRQPWPNRLMVADRSYLWMEILVFSGSLRETVVRLLTKGTQPRGTRIGAGR